MWSYPEFALSAHFPLPPLHATTPGNFRRGTLCENYFWGSKITPLRYVCFALRTLFNLAYLHPKANRGTYLIGGTPIYRRGLILFPFPVVKSEVTRAF